MGLREKAQFVNMGLRDKAKYFRKVGEQNKKSDNKMDIPFQDTTKPTDSTNIAINKIFQLTLLFDGWEKDFHVNQQLTQVMDQLLQAIIRIFNIEMSAILTVDQNMLIFADNIGMSQDTASRFNIPMSHQIIKDTLSQPEPIIITNYNDHEEWANLFSSEDIEKTNTFMLLPIIISGEIIFVFAFFKIKEMFETTAIQKEYFSIIHTLVTYFMRNLIY